MHKICYDEIKDIYSDNYVCDNSSDAYHNFNLIRAFLRQCENNINELNDYDKEKYYIKRKDYLNHFNIKNK